MFCTKCGSKLENNSKFCINCGNPTNINTYNTNSNKNNVEYNKKDSKLVTYLCLLAYAIPFFGLITIWILTKTIALEFQLAAGLMVLLNIIGFIMLIVINAMYPKYKRANVFLAVYILITILVIIALVIAFMSLIVTCFEGLTRI